MSKVFTITEGLENLGALRTGGQGSVYKGKRTGSIYSAVKLIPTPIYKESLEDKNYRNFKNEVAKLHKVNENPSPNVVKMLSSGITESGSFPFIEMEYIEGPDLCELLQPPHEKVFTLKELLKVAEQLASALAHCHKVGVKHGDIKSNNVKFNVQTGNYILLDFGLAIMSEEQRRSSIRHAGAVEFMAPEQNEGKMLLQSDVYSYGVILYELLGGQVPFPLPGNSDTGRNTVMIGHLENDVPDVLELRKANLPATWSEEQKVKELKVPEWLLALIDKCLQKDPAHRFEDGIQLHEHIIAATLSGTPTPASPTVSSSINPLQAENDALRKQLSKLKRNDEPVETSGVRLSTFAFASLIIALVGLIIFTVYAEFFRNNETQIVDNPTDTTSIKVDTGTLSFEEQANERALIRAAEKKRVIDSAAKEEFKRSQEKPIDTTEDLTPDTSAGSQEI